MALTTEIRAIPPRDFEWQAIADALAPQGRFATTSWIRAWGEHYLPDQHWRPPLRYLTVRSADGGLRAVIPLATQRRLGLSVTALGGFYWPFRVPAIPDAAGEDVYAALADACTRVRSMLALRCGPVPESLRSAKGFARALQQQGWRLHRSTLGETYSVVLPESWPLFETRLGKSLRTNASYYERKMRREGLLDIRHYTARTRPSWSQVVNELGLIERLSWQHREGCRTPFSGRPSQGFWKALLADAAFARMLRVWLMYFNGQPVSCCLCLDCEETRYIIANYYAEHVHAYSTGTILYRHVFRDAIEAGSIRRVDLGLGDSGYKTRWGAQPADRLVDWIAFRPGLGGWLLDRANAMWRGQPRDGSTPATASVMKR